MLGVVVIAFEAFPSWVVVCDVQDIPFFVRILTPQQVMQLVANGGIYKKISTF